MNLNVIFLVFIPLSLKGTASFLSFESDIIWVNINSTGMILIAYNFKTIYDFTNFLVYDLYMYVAELGSIGIE